ncbi:MAG TPA: ATPase, T2SS/T4P/T4SS family [Gammaproteobacteria bacterium]|nr:ATPase, T2SS/T4P/T4SS family [Gammaproteobacteria bacterium]
MTTPFKSRSLISILVDQRHIGPAVAENYAREPDAAVMRKLLDEKLVPEGSLYSAVAEQCRLPYVSLDGYVITPALFDCLPAAVAYKLEVAPYSLSGNVLQVVTSNPYNLSMQTRLEQVTRKQIQLLVSFPDAIRAALKRSEGSAQILKGVSEDFRIEIIKENDAGEEETLVLDELRQDDSGTIVRLVNTIIHDAIQRRASDIHIEIYETGLAVKYRIDGVIYDAMETLDPAHHPSLISRLKVMADLDIAEKQVPQDGRFKLRLGKRDIDFRVSVLPGTHGENVVIRILDKGSLTDAGRSLSLESLGISELDLKRLRRSIREPYGMILITGPTGSGKTTTLYAALGELNTGAEKIITIEDPVEYRLEGIVQIPVNEKKNLTFARGLRSVLRHDPDKIMVGEIRDVETAQIAVQSALTGHLVLTTVHANNALDVIARFTHMGVDLYNFVSALNCVMAQRLIRRICPGCRRAVALAPAVLEQAGLDPAACRGRDFYEGAGCADCHNTGYLGRLAITEYLQASPAIKEKIVRRGGYMELLETARNEGFVSLRQSALEKLLAGQTTLQEINRVTSID